MKTLTLYDQMIRVINPQHYLYTVKTLLVPNLGLNFSSNDKMIGFITKNIRQVILDTRAKNGSIEGLRLVGAVNVAGDFHSTFKSYTVGIRNMSSKDLESAYMIVVAKSAPAAMGFIVDAIDKIEDEALRSSLCIITCELSVETSNIINL
jgi:hypothetical protein